MGRLKLFLPLIIFVLLAAMFFGVQRRVQEGEYSPTALPSALLNRPMPAFDLPTFVPPCTISPNLHIKIAAEIRIPQMYRRHNALLLVF